MPSKNVLRAYDVDAYYHVYNRGVGKKVIFVDDEDYATFLNLLKRHLIDTPTFDASGREYERLGGDMRIVAFCIMPNHFHLLAYQSEPDAIIRLMRKVCTPYARYFNHKYEWTGHVFQGPYRASRITNESYLLHIGRYIHLNPENYLGWQWSSLGAYLGRRHYEWVHPTTFLGSDGASGYLKFVEDYRDYRAKLKQIKKQLADM